MGKSKELFMNLHEDLEREFMRDRIYTEEEQYFFEEDPSINQLKEDESNYRDKQGYKQDLPF